MKRNLTDLFKKEKNSVSHKNVTCKNCGTIFDGNFCPNCGQSVTEYDKPFSHIILTFTGDLFAFDTRFFHTFFALLFKPGFLSKEYIEGRRMKYAPPFRIFVFMSFVLFMLLQIYSNRGLSKILNYSFTNEDGTEISSSFKTFVDSVFYNVDIEINDSIPPDSVLNELGFMLVPKDSGKAELKIKPETFRKMQNLRHGLNIYAKYFEDKLLREKDQNERENLEKIIVLLRTPDQTIAKFLKHISWAFFLLLPVFAFILKLVYVRRKYNYMRHLIFSIHIHSFVFVMLTLIIALNLIFSADLSIITLILFLLMPVYLIIALKKFYGQNYFKVIFKFLILTLLYNIIFWPIVYYSLADVL